MHTDGNQPQDEGGAAVQSLESAAQWMLLPTPTVQAGMAGELQGATATVKATKKRTYSKAARATIAVPMVS